MFKGKESSNRIELLNFGVLGSLWLWRGGRWVGGHLGAWGVSPHTCTCTCMHTCTHAHLYMYRNCKWLPTWRHPCLACLTCMCVHACTCVCMRACMGHPPTHPYPPPPPSTHPPPPQGGGAPESLKIR